MEAININTLISLSYALLPCLAILLTWIFGRKMPMLKKILTVCALTFTFVIGLPIAEVASHYFLQFIMTRERYEWMNRHPNTFFIYKNLFSLLYTLIFCGIFLQRKSNDHYESSPSFKMPILLLITIGINYLIILVMNIDVYPHSTLFNNVGMALASFSLLAIILILWPTKEATTFEPKFGIFIASITFIAYSLIFGILCYFKYTEQSLELFYSSNTINILTKTTCLSLILLSGLLLLRYIVYQNSIHIQFNIANSLSPIHYRQFTK